MDVITQGALGAACAQAVLGKYNKHIPWTVGALSGMAADLDVFIQFSQEPMSAELWHRNFSHSITFIPFGALLVALCLMCFPYFRRKWQLVIMASLIGYATHGLLDAFTPYGTVLFWPWSDVRISWDVVAIINLVFTLPLVLGTAWSVIHQEQSAAVFALLFSGLFLVFNALQHQRALNSVAEYARQHSITLTNIRAMPHLMSSTHWRIIAKNDQCFLIAESITPIGGVSRVKVVGRFSSYSEALVPFKLTAGQQHDLQIFNWFSSGYLLVASKNPWIVADGRYTSGSNPVFSFWGVELSPQQGHVKKLRFIQVKERCNN